MAWSSKEAVAYYTQFPEALEAWRNTPGAPMFSFMEQHAAQNPKYRQSSTAPATRMVETTYADGPSSYSTPSPHVTKEDPKLARQRAQPVWSQADAARDAYLQQFDWYNDPLWKYAMNGNLTPGVVGYGEWTGGREGRIANPKDPYTELMAKYGTVNLNEYLRQQGVPFAPKGMSGDPFAAQEYYQTVQNWVNKKPSIGSPRSSGMLSGGSTSPATPPVGAPALPGGATPPVAPSGGSSGSFGGASPVTGAGMLNNSQNVWVRPTTPAQTNLRTVPDSSAWRARPRMLT